MMTHEMKQYGYTHLVKYERWLDICKLWMPSSFPTTEDVVSKHVSGLKKNVKIRNVVVEEL